LYGSLHGDVLRRCGLGIGSALLSSTSTLYKPHPAFIDDGKQSTTGNKRKLVVDQNTLYDFVHNKNHSFFPTHYLAFDRYKNCVVGIAESSCLRDWLAHSK
jgi:hypothetical protein